MSNFSDRDSVLHTLVEPSTRSENEKENKVVKVVRGQKLCLVCCLKHVGQKLQYNGPTITDFKGETFIWPRVIAVVHNEVFLRVYKLDRAS